MVDDLETRLTSVRAGYLDSLNGHTPQTGDSYSVVTNVTYGLSVLEGLVDDLETRLTSVRAGYLDNLNGHTPQSGDTYAALPTNFSSLVISAGGAVDALWQGVLNTLLTETTAGRIAGNLSIFWGNADAATTKTVDNVGEATTEELDIDVTEE